jgi:hypothetical protein
MSKTTVTLLVFLFIFLGILLFIVYGIKQNPIINSFNKSIPAKITPFDTSLSLSSETQTLQLGQTATIAVLIHNVNPHLNIAQVDLGYDPNVLTIDSITPGTLFKNPTIALDTIDPVAGRISYALRCPVSQSPVGLIDCADLNSMTLATITVSVNSYAQQNTTTISFLPKTVVRIKNGRDALQKASNLQLTIGSPNYTSSSEAKILQPNFIKVTPSINK